MNAIADYKFYVSEMEKGLQDKLFFMDKINFSTLLDYGCADGMLIESMSNYYPDKKYIGYDFDEKMIKLSKNKNIHNASFYSDLDIANNNILNSTGKTAILCSSLIHEVYSYGTKEDIKNFWNNLFSGTYDYVIIRDMTLSQEVKMEKTDPSDIQKLFENGDLDQIKEFESIWGSVWNKANFIHYLMKYRYLKNWNREVMEDYFPVSIQEHLAQIPHNFEIIHFEHFSLPFQREVILKDFGIEMNEKTHIKIILKCNKKSLI